MRLYQKPCAGVNSGFEDFEGKKPEFQNSLYGSSDDPGEGKQFISPEKWTANDLNWESR